MTNVENLVKVMFSTVLESLECENEKDESNIMLESLWDDYERIRNGENEITDKDSEHKITDKDGKHEITDKDLIELELIEEDIAKIYIRKNRRKFYERLHQL
jgi:hypothetical protein